MKSDLDIMDSYLSNFVKKVFSRSLIKTEISVQSRTEKLGFKWKQDRLVLVNHNCKIQDFTFTDTSTANNPVTGPMECFPNPLTLLTYASVKEPIEAFGKERHNLEGDWENCQLHSTGPIRFDMGENGSMTCGYVCCSVKHNSCQSQSRETMLENPLALF